jgi:quercetin dioxygenase-like cupin family protein
MYWTAEAAVFILAITAGIRLLRVAPHQPLEQITSRTAAPSPHRNESDRPDHEDALASASIAALLLTTYAALADDMVVAHPDTLKWGEAPSVLPKGAQLAVITGDPGKAGSYVIRIKVPAGYQIPAHWHSTAENLTVLSGSVNVGMGDTLDARSSKRLEVGSFTYLPAKMNHFLWTSVPAIFQIHAEGPFDIVYVNPKDDPSKPHM